MHPDISASPIVLVEGISQSSIVALVKEMPSAIDTFDMVA